VADTVSTSELRSGCRSIALPLVPAALWRGLRAGGRAATGGRQRRPPRARTHSGPRRCRRRGPFAWRWSRSPSWSSCSSSRCPGRAVTVELLLVLLLLALGAYWLLGRYQRAGRRTLGLAAASSPTRTTRCSDGRPSAPSACCSPAGRTSSRRSTAPTLRSSTSVLAPTPAVAHPAGRRPVPAHRGALRGTATPRRRRARRRRARAGDLQPRARAGRAAGHGGDAAQPRQRRAARASVGGREVPRLRFPARLLGRGRCRSGDPPIARTG
jgi:hypothetical protein